MNETQFLDPIQVLYGANQSLVNEAVLINKGKIVAFGEKARAEAMRTSIPATPAGGQLLAPCLVDPHSVLEESITGKQETLTSLCKAAASSGYGRLALLPRSPSCRDRPERLNGFSLDGDVIIDLWGSYSKDGERKELSAHGELIQKGAIGLAEDDFMPPLSLLQRGLLLGEMKDKPILLAPRDKAIQADGMVREGVETLRAGWMPDPILSETLPLGQLIELQKQYPECSIRVMNISTSPAVDMLSLVRNTLMTTVCWWHLVADRTLLEPTDLGWCVSPSLGGQEDRFALIKGLKEGVIHAIAVNSIPLDEEDIQQPPDQRQAGLAGHQLVLPALWNELVIKEGLSIERLWQFLSFGPSKILGVPEERLSVGSHRWLIFDPNKSWIQKKSNKFSPLAANQPWEGKTIKGKVIASGLKA